MRTLHARTLIVTDYFQTSYKESSPNPVPVRKKLCSMDLTIFLFRVEAVFELQVDVQTKYKYKAQTSLQLRPST
jgi:hypothetical protein